MDLMLYTRVKRWIQSLTAADIGAAPAEHNHDERYYTQGEVDERLQDIVSGDIADRSIVKSKLELPVQQTLDAADAHLAAAEGAHDASVISYGDSNVATALSAVEQGIANSVPLGESNAEVALLKTLLLDVSTRQLHATDWTQKGNPTALEIRDEDGETVLGTITITYNAAEKPTEAVATIFRGGEDPITVTMHQEFDPDNPAKFIRRWKGEVVS